MGAALAIVYLPLFDHILYIGNFSSVPSNAPFQVKETIWLGIYPCLELPVYLTYTDLD